MDGWLQEGGGSQKGSEDLGAGGEDQGLEGLEAWSRGKGPIVGAYIAPKQGVLRALEALCRR